ncbi:MAG: DUF1080 domain-containing protein [Woeseiaceae bacterium]|nr:DUF1080 domain-containing protein [Woeseiaceae bacterium]
MKNYLSMIRRKTKNVAAISTLRRGKLIILLCVFNANFLISAEEIVNPEETEIWGPIPSIIDTSSQSVPSDAIILFDGESLHHWEKIDGSEALWLIEENAFTIKPGTGDIVTKKKFSDLQLHIEWRTPIPEDAIGQNRGNSGIFLQRRYELQVLDSFNNETYVNGQAGSIYKQYIPLVNASRGPGIWQTYDIVFKAPTFNMDKSLKTNASMTVLHNGVLIQNNSILRGSTTYIGLPEYEFHEKDSILLQDHGSKISFRNVWAREL